MDSYTKHSLVMWTGGVLLALVVAAFIVLTTRTVMDQGTQRLEACIEAGHPPAECAVALRNG